MTEQYTWNPPEEPLAIFSDNPVPENPSEGFTFSIGARTIQRSDGEILCPDNDETILWGLIARQENHEVTIEEGSAAHAAANRFASAGLLMAEHDIEDHVVTLRLHPNATIEDLRQSEDPYDEKATERQSRTIEEIKAELTEKGFVLTSAEELGLPVVDGVDPTTHVIKKYSRFLRRYKGDRPRRRKRATGLIAVRSAVEFDQSREPTVPTYAGDSAKKRPKAYDFVDMVSDPVLGRLCEVNMQLLPDHYSDRSLRYSLNVFKVFRAIARTAHTDGGVQNVIWRLGHRSGRDGGWTYILRPQEGTQAKDGRYQKIAVFASRLAVGQILIVDDERFGHTSKDNSGRRPKSETVVLATLPAAA